MYSCFKRKGDPKPRTGLNSRSSESKRMLRRGGAEEPPTPPQALETQLENSPREKGWVSVSLTSCFLSGPVSCFQDILPFNPPRLLPTLHPANTLAQSRFVFCTALAQPSSFFKLVFDLRKLFCVFIVFRLLTHAPLKIKAPLGPRLRTRHCCMPNTMDLEHLGCSEIR